MGVLFIISVVFCSIVGSFFSMIVDANLMEKKKTWKRVIVWLIVAIGFGFILTCAIFTDAKIEAEKWNNGICVECNGKYKFSGATHYRTSEYYYYTCENCDYTIELNTLQNN